MEEYEDFLKTIDDAVRKKSEAIRARRREKGKGKAKGKRTGKEKGVDFSEPAKTCEEPAYAVPVWDHDEKLPKTEARERDFIKALRGMLKPIEQLQGLNALMKSFVLAVKGLPPHR